MINSFATSILRSAVLICSITAPISVATASPSYPAPFDSVRSVFGPRHDASSLHSGIDYSAPASTAIPAAAAGVISSIFTHLNNCGVRMYVVTADGIEVGYCHLFKDGAGTLSSGDFTLLQNVVFYSRLSASALRISAVSKRCNVILSHSQRKAFVASECDFGSGRVVAFNGMSYSVTSKVTDRQLIAPVGDSGTAAGKPHLHLNYNRGQDNPMYVTDHPNGAFCARLEDAGASASACEAAGTPPAIDPATLASRKYIEVRVDSTARLDLDQLRFSFSNAPGQQYNVQYGGSPTMPQYINGSADLLPAISIGCTKIPAVGEVVICPKDWSGQQAPASRLETKFRLGIDPAAFPAGNHALAAHLTPVTGGSAAVFSLPFSVKCNNSIGGGCAYSLVMESEDDPGFCVGQINEWTIACFAKKFRVKCVGQGCAGRTFTFTQTDQQFRQPAPPRGCSNVSYGLGPKYVNGTFSITLLREDTVWSGGTSRYVQRGSDQGGTCATELWYLGSVTITDGHTTSVFPFSGGPN